MLGRRRFRKRILHWTMAVIVLGTFYVVAAGQSLTITKKTGANRILSPWDVSKAPDPVLSPASVKVKPLIYKPKVVVDGPNVKAFGRQRRQNHRG